jgi:hypothetical protein
MANNRSGPSSPRVAGLAGDFSSMRGRELWPEQCGGPEWRNPPTELDARAAAPGPLGGWAAAWVARRVDMGACACGRWLPLGPASGSVGAPSLWCLVASVVVCHGARLLEGLAGHTRHRRWQEANWRCECSGWRLVWQRQCLWARVWLRQDRVSRLCFRWV